MRKMYRTKEQIFLGISIRILDMSNVEYRTIIKFFTQKGLNATKITKELKEVYNDSSPAYRTIAKWVAEFKDDPTRDFEDAPRSGRSLTTTTDENIKVVNRL